MKLWVRKSTVCFQFKVALGASGLRLHLYDGYQGCIFMVGIIVDCGLHHLLLHSGLYHFHFLGVCAIPF